MLRRTRYAAPPSPCERAAGTDRYGPLAFEHVELETNDRRRAFLMETARALWMVASPWTLQAGLGELAPSLDVFTPFCSLIARGERKDCGPGVMRKVAEVMRPVRKLRPVIPLVKLYWQQATRNSTADILHAMDEAKEAGLAGFFLWYRSLSTNELAKRVSFELPAYDFGAICDTYRELAAMRGRKKTRRERMKRP